MARQAVCALILILVTLTRGEPKRRFSVKIFDYNCNHTSLLKLFTCEYGMAGPSIYHFSNHYIFANNIETEFILRIIVDIKQQFAKLNVRVLDVKFDLCNTRSMQMFLKNSLLGKLVPEIYEASSYMIECPFVAGQLYKLENFTVSQRLFPKYTPELNFNATMEYYQSSSLMGTHTTTGCTVFDKNEKGKAL